MGNISIGSTGVKNPTLVVKLDQAQVVSGGMLVGRIYLDIPVDFFPCTSVDLFIQGYEETSVNYTTHSGSGKHRRTHHHTARETLIFMSLPVTISTITTEGLRKGNYEYPFQLVMPSGLIGSFRGSKFRVDYRVVASLASSQTAKSGQIQHTALFSVISGLPQIPSVPLYMPPVITPVVTMCCINRGGMAVGALVSNSIVVPGETFRVSYAVQNLSTVRIKAVQLEVTRTINISARDHRGVHRQSMVDDLISRRIEAAELVGLEIRPDDKAHTDFTALSSEILRSLKVSIDQGKFVIDTMLDRNVVLPSYAGNLVNVSYVIKFTVHTTFGTNNIIMAQPLQVVFRLPVANADIGYMQQVPVVAYPVDSSDFPPPPAYTEIPQNWAPVRSEMIHIAAGMPVMVPSAMGAPPNVDGSGAQYAEIPVNFGPTPSHEVGTYSDLLQTVSTSMAPVAAAEWWLGTHTQFAVDNLNSQELSKLFMSLKQSVDQVNFADLLSSKMSRIRCDTLALILGSTGEIARREVATRLLQRVPIEDKHNKAVVFSTLSPFDSIALEPFFA
jgi:hypothetical protein